MQLGSHSWARFPWPFAGLSSFLLEKKKQWHVYPWGRGKAAVCRGMACHGLGLGVSARFSGVKEGGSREGGGGRGRASSSRRRKKRNGGKEGRRKRERLDGLHNCSELNSSLVAPPEITSPHHSHVIIFCAAAAPFRVYVLVLLVGFVNELRPGLIGFLLTSRRMDSLFQVKTSARRSPLSLRNRGTRGRARATNYYFIPVERVEKRGPRDGRARDP